MVIQSLAAEKRRRLAAIKSRRSGSDDSTKKTFIVRDTQTGKVIRVGTVGAGISETKLQARAQEVARQTGGRVTRVSEQEARARAATPLSLVQRQEQLKAAKQKELQAQKEKKFQQEQEVKKEQERKKTKDLILLQQALKENRASGLAKIFTEKQQRQIFRSFQRTDDPDIPYLTSSDIDFITKSNVKDIKNVKSKLANQRKKQYEQSLRLPFNIQKKQIREIKNKNIFTKNWTDKQIKNYILANMISKPSLADKFIARPSLIVRGVKSQIQNPSEVISNIIDLQKKGLWSPKEDRRFKQILKTMPREIALGLGEVLFDIARFTLIQIPKGAFFITGKSIDYGKNLVKRSAKGQGRPIKIINQDIDKLLNKGANISKWLDEHPTEAAIIVGVAIAEGHDTTGRKFNANPVREFTKTITFLRFNKIVKGSSKILKNISSQVSKVAFSTTETKSLAAQIKFLESIKGKSREQQLLLKDLKTLSKEEKRLFDLRNDINRIESSIKSGKIKPNVAKKKIKGVVEEWNKVKIELPKKKKKAKFKAIKLTDKKKSELIGNLFIEKVDNIKVKIIKGLPQDEETLNKLLLEARKLSGTAFKKLKNKIKKELGLNVIQRRDSKGKVFFKLLEPKKQKKKGIKTKRQKTIEFIISKDKIKVKPTLKKQPIPKETRLSKRDLKDLEFKEGQNIDKIQKDIRRMSKAGVFKNKKAQARLTFNVNKFYRNMNKKATKVKKETQKFINKYHPRQSRKAINPRTRSKTDWSKEDIARYKKSKQKVINLTRSTTKEINKVISKLGIRFLVSIGFIKLLSKLDANLLAQGNMQLSNQSKTFQQILKQINKFETPKPKPTPKQKSGSTKTIKPRPKTKPKPSPKPRPKQKPSIRRKTSPKQKPVKKPLKLDFDWDSKKLKDKIVLYAATFRERKNRNLPFNKISNPVITKNIKRLTTRNRMVNEIANLADNRTVRSIRIRAVKLTNKKKKDVLLKGTINKFGRKKSKNTPVLDLVEKTKHISDRPGEKRELKVTRRIATKNKPKVKRVAKKKKSSRMKPKRTKKTNKPNTKPKKRPNKKKKK